VGGPYNRGLAKASLEILESFYRVPGQQIKVSEQDELTADRKLIVRFDVISYPDDVLFIDGRQITPQSSATNSDFRRAPQPFFASSVSQLTAVIHREQFHSGVKF
jgi:hypothetical protein